MAGFRRILCATDLSEASDWALQEADREARLHGAGLAILHALPSSYGGAPMQPDHLEAAMVRQETLASEIIDSLLERLERLTGRDAGQVTVMVEEGDAAETIIAQADEFSADLIVVGSTGQTGDSLRFGSVAQAVAKHAHVPVLVARPGGETGRILLATDFAGSSESASRLAADEAVRRCAGVTAVHSIEVLSPEVALGEPGSMPPVAFGAYPIEEMRAATRKRLGETLAELGLSGEVLAVEGPPGDAIVQVAAREHSDLIVIGTSGRTGIDRLLLGSVATDVIRRAPCSVLVAREPMVVPRRMGLPSAHLAV
jgi:nucleotide-binding universal stress UspA family protein